MRCELGFAANSRASFEAGAGELLLSEAVYFVWRDSQHARPVPEIWHGEKTVDGRPLAVLAKHRLSPQEAMLARLGRLSIKELAATYRPPPAPPPEPKIRLVSA